MQKKGAALRAVQADDGQEAGKVCPSTGSGRTEIGRAQEGKVGETLPARLEFTPVPRRYRHDGWTPERQRAFIAALADTGCVDRAARMVNMAQANCYALRRAPGAEGFARAWAAALDCGLLLMKDIAFERAIEGQLVPVFSQGKLMGYRRKRNDALLMFCLRHYGQDANGKRVTVNYFSSRASASGASADAGPTPGPSRKREGGMAAAEASMTTVRTVISGRGAGPGTGAGLSEAAGVLNGFEGVRLDAEAEAAIARALLDCAARARAAEAAGEAGGAAAEAAAADDPGAAFFRSQDYHGELIPAFVTEDYLPFVEGEPHWQLAGAEKPDMLVKWEDEQARRSPGPAEDVRDISSPVRRAGKKGGAGKGARPPAGP